MKIEEAVKRIEQMGEYERFIDEPISKVSVLNTIRQINQPKLEVPQFMVDWVNNSREWHYDFDEWFDCDNQPMKVYKWLNCKNKRQAELNALALMTLIVNGPDAVTVEKEKLYTVEIPNPHAKGHNKIYLCKDGNTGKVYLCKGNFNPKKNKNLRLTEKEIKKDFDWAWQWKKEVKE